VLLTPCFQGLRAVALLESARPAVPPLQCGSQSVHMRTTPSASHRGTDSTLAATTGSHSLRLMQPPLKDSSPATFGGSSMSSCAPITVHYDLPKVGEPRRESPGTPPRTLARPMSTLCKEPSASVEVCKCECIF
jgi:hypothetical protein